MLNFLFNCVCFYQSIILVLKCQSLKNYYHYHNNLPSGEFHILQYKLPIEMNKQIRKRAAEQTPFPFIFLYVSLYLIFFVLDRMAYACNYYVVI